MRQMAVKLFAPGASILIVALAFVAFQFGPTLFEDEWLREARSAHERWRRDEPPADGAVIPEARFLSALRALGPTPHLPDLAGAGLRIARVVAVGAEADAPTAFHVGYVGDGNDAGCRLSLWITRASEDAEPALATHRERDAYSWTDQGLRYVLIARDMHNDRLHVIAIAALEMTATRSGPGERITRTLRLAKMLNRPCGG